MRRLKRVRLFRFGIVLTATVVAAALAAGLASSDTTTTLQPVANGTHIDWFGDVQDVDETSSFNCGGADSIGKGGADPDRESFTVDITSIPIGATITSVAVAVRDGGHPTDLGGTYQTFARINATDTDSGVNLTPTEKLFDECSETKTQTIDVPDVVRSETTTLEIGVVKTPPDGSAIRVGTITATVTYNEAPATLVVITNVVNDDGGTVVASDFSMSVVRPPDSLLVQFPGVGPPGHSVTLDPGVYSVSVGGTGATVYYDISFSPDCLGPIAAGEMKTCTVTADDQSFGTLEVVTRVVNDNGGTASASDWTMSVSGGNPIPASFPGVGSIGGREVRLDPGAYSVSASGPTGYSLSFSAACSGTIVARETKTCIATVDDQPGTGTLVVITNVVNDDGGLSGADTFRMSVTGGNPSPASFPGEGPPGRSVSLDPGTYRVSIDSTDLFILGYTSAHSPDCVGTIAAGETKTCTVTVDDNPHGLLLVTTKVVNDNGGTASASAWTISVTGGNPDPASFPGDGFFSQVRLDPGPYSVSASGPAGYGITLSAGCSGIIVARQRQVCTVTADDQPGTLVVITNVVNDDGGLSGADTFRMSVTGGNPSPASFPGEGPPGRSVSLDPGTYRVSIDSTDLFILGYTSAHSPDCVGTIAAGETKTCTVTVDDNPHGLLLVTTKVVNDNGGTASASAWTISVTGGNPDPASFPGDGFFSQVRLDPGPYSVSASGPAGYGITLSAGCSGIIVARQRQVCTVTADDQPGTLVVITNVVNDDGGLSGADTFRMSVTGGNPSPASFPGEGPPGRSVSLDPGTYRVSIDSTDLFILGYTSAHSPDCVGTIAAGETKTCTVTVDDNPHGLLLVTTKVVNDNGGTASASAWTISVTGGNPDPASFPGDGFFSQVRLDPGPYSVSASGPAGYGITLSAGCSGIIVARQRQVCTVTADDQPATEQLIKLTEEVINASALPPALRAQLTATLRALIANFDPQNATQRRAACVALSVFRGAVQLLSGRGIPPALATKWIADANRIRAVLGC